MAQQITVVLNGTERTFNGLSDKPNLAELVTALGFRADRVAVEQNGDIVQRSAWTEVSLRSGDRIELVHFVGGGSLMPNEMNV